MESTALGCGSKDGCRGQLEPMVVSAPLLQPPLQVGRHPLAWPCRRDPGEFQMNNTVLGTVKRFSVQRRKGSGRGAQTSCSPPHPGTVPSAGTGPHLSIPRCPPVAASSCSPPPPQDSQQPDNVCYAQAGMTGSPVSRVATIGPRRQASEDGAAAGLLKCFGNRRAWQLPGLTWGLSVSGQRCIHTWTEAALMRQTAWSLSSALWLQA